MKIHEFLLACLCFGLGGAFKCHAMGPVAPEADGMGGRREFRVWDFGAKGDGKQLDTGAIQGAIDACARQGGGTVVLPKGDFLSAGLVLRDHVTLYLAGGARILGTGNPEDYRQHGCVIYAAEAKNIALAGPGIIDGKGAGVRDHRYLILRFRRCQGISLRDLTLKDSAVWCAHFIECDQVRIDGIQINRGASIKRTPSNNTPLPEETVNVSFFTRCKG